MNNESNIGGGLVCETQEEGNGEESWVSGSRKKSRESYNISIHYSDPTSSVHHYETFLHKLLYPFSIFYSPCSSCTNKDRIIIHHPIKYVPTNT